MAIIATQHFITETQGIGQDKYPAISQNNSVFMVILKVMWYNKLSFAKLEVKIKPLISVVLVYLKVKNSGTQSVKREMQSAVAQYET